VFPSIREGEAGSDDAESCLRIDSIAVPIKNAVKPKEWHKTTYLL
jgi:hypothetical protein